jgi:V8-like Glu-specific endopeptidase
MGRTDLRINARYPIPPGILNKPSRIRTKKDAKAFIRELESRCGGTTESQDVESYDGRLGVTKQFVKRHQGPVGQIQWNTNLHTIYKKPGNVRGIRWASGTLISNNIFLTAAHVFDPKAGGYDVPKVNGTNKKISPPEIAKCMHVNFNYQYDPEGETRQEKRYAISELVEYRTRSLDYAIVKLDKSPGRKFGFAAVSSSDPAVGDMLCIIGHTEGLPKRIEAGPATGVENDIITYNDIDTLFGDSGSGILSSPDGELVGVHTTGGCDREHIGFNSGLRISVIRSASRSI